jgi:nicotinamidase-related amidase
MTDATTALALIDLQRDLVCDDDGGLPAWAASAVGQSVACAAWARSMGMQVFWIRVARQHEDLPLSARSAPRSRPRLVACTPGAELAPQVHAAPGDRQIAKSRVSAFSGTSLAGDLQASRTTRLLLGSVFTHMGVEATARAAYDLDIEPVTLADCCAAPSQPLHEHSIARVLPLRGHVGTWPTVAAEYSNP